MSVFLPGSLAPVPTQRTWLQTSRVSLRALQYIVHSTMSEVVLSDVY